MPDVGKVPIAGGTRRHVELRVLDRPVVDRIIRHKFVRIEGVIRILESWDAFI